MTHVTASDFETISTKVPTMGWIARIWYLFLGCGKAVVCAVQRSARQNLDHTPDAELLHRQLQHDMFRIEARRRL